MTENKYVSRYTQELVIAFNNARIQFEQAIHNPASAEPDTRACARAFLVAFARVFSRAVETVPTDERDCIAGDWVRGTASRNEFYARFPDLDAHIRNVHSAGFEFERSCGREWSELEVAPERGSEQRARLVVRILEHMVEHTELVTTSITNHMNCVQFATARLQQINDAMLAASVINAFSAKLSGT